MNRASASGSLQVGRILFIVIRVNGKTIAENRRVRHDYEIDETYEAGLALSGTEVKSLRESGINLKDSYAKIEKGEVFLVGTHIAPFSSGNRFNHNPERPRKLLLKRREIRRLTGKIAERGFTLVPLKVYFTQRGIAKVLLGLGKGKAKHDKRHAIRDRDIKRDMERELHNR
jgi:SsrA-binding protein